MRVKTLLLVVLLCGACTPMTRVMVLKPPQADIKNIRRVAVIDLITSYNFDSEVIKTIQQQLVKKLKKNTTYQYVDPKNISSTLKKEKLNKDEYQNPDHAGRIGRILGVDTIIYGTVLAYNSTDDVAQIKTERDPYSGELFFRKGLKFVRRVDIAIKFEIVPVNGDKPVNKTISAEVTSEQEESRSGFAKAALEPEEDLYKEALDEVGESLIKLIAPHKEEEFWPLKTGEHPALIMGNNYAENGKWDLARSAWKTVLKNDSRQDRDAALFNLGLLAENEGKLDEAAEIFQKLLDKNHDSETRDILRRIIENKSK